MNVFTIKDLEQLSGIKAHTIRIWEQRYSFLNPNRTDTNIRFYSNDELRTLLNIALLNKHGFKISHINQMNAEELKDKVLALTSEEAVQERMMHLLIQYMVEVDFLNFESTLDAHINKYGIENSILQLIFPFLERVGILWLTNQIKPAQEHIITNIIRQKLIYGIEILKQPTVKSELAILFLPEGEHHELGLLFMYYLLKSKGMQVMYLGSNLPIDDIIFLSGLKSPRFIYTHLTSHSSNFNLEKLLAIIRREIPKQEIVISGPITKQYQDAVPKNVQILTSLQQAIEFTDSLSKSA